MFIVSVTEPRVTWGRGLWTCWQGINLVTLIEVDRSILNVGEAILDGGRKVGRSGGREVGRWEVLFYVKWRQ